MRSIKRSIVHVHAVTARGGVKVQLHSFITSTLEGAQQLFLDYGALRRGMHQLNAPTECTY